MPRKTQTKKQKENVQEVQNFAKTVLAAWAIQDYNKVAKLGAVEGAVYMQDEVGRVPNDDLNFAPEIHVFKNNTVEITGCLFDIDIEGQRDLVRRFLTASDGVLLITLGTISKMAAVNNPEKLPVKSFSDHITASVGQVFIPSFELVAAQALPVGTDEELQTAGFRPRGMGLN